MPEVLQNILSTVLLIAGLYAALQIFRVILTKIADKKRSLDLVFLKIQVPKKESKEDVEREQAAAGKDFKEVLGVGAHMYESLHSIYSKGLKRWFIGQDFFSLEYA